jgi:hypothetical protein
MTGGRTGGPGQAKRLIAPPWIALVAAAVIVPLVIGLAVGLASRSSRSVAPPEPSPPPESSLPPFVCTSEGMGSGAANPSVAFVVRLSDSARSGYDRLTVQFSKLPTGNIGISTQSGATFTSLANGRQVSLAGRNGILVTIQGADSHTSYHGPTDIVTGHSTLKEVRLLEDSAGVVQLGLGVDGPACYRAVLLTNPDRLLIDVQRA